MGSCNFVAFEEFTCAYYYQSAIIIIQRHLSLIHYQAQKLHAPASFFSFLSFLFYLKHDW